MIDSLTKIIFSGALAALVLALPLNLGAQDDEGAAEPPPASIPATQLRPGDPGFQPPPRPTPEPTPEPTPAPPPAPADAPAPTEDRDDTPPPAPATGEAPRQQGGQTPSSLGQFTLNIDRESRMVNLQVEGQQGRASAQVIVGTEFTTHVIFDNQDSAPFDAVRILLSYSTDSLEPVAINDSPIADFLLGDPTAEVDTRFGMILYEGQLIEPLIIKDAPVISVRWRALRVTATTPIEFSSRQDMFTTLTFRDTDLLGNRRIAGDGTLSLALQILPEDPREAEAMLTDPSLFLRPDEKMGGVELYLRRQPEPVYAGEPFYIDIILDNRAFSMLDGLSILLDFDPEILRIIDVDRDNWITRETNVHDGIFRDLWPWDMHIDNSVYQSRGIISYRKATTDGEMTRGKYGPVARIWAVASTPTQGTAIVFRYSPRPRSQGTRVTYVGEDVLGDPNVANDGATGIVMGINPARARRNQ